MKYKPKILTLIVFFLMEFSCHCKTLLQKNSILLFSIVALAPAIVFVLPALMADAAISNSLFSATSMAAMFVFSVVVFFESKFLLPPVFDFYVDSYLKSFPLERWQVKASRVISGVIVHLFSSLMFFLSCVWISSTKGYAYIVLFPCFVLVTLCVDEVFCNRKSISWLALVFIFLAVFLNLFNAMALALLLSFLFFLRVELRKYISSDARQGTFFWKLLKQDGFQVLIGLSLLPLIGFFLGVGHQHSYEILAFGTAVITFYGVRLVIEAYEKYVPFFYALPYGKENLKKYYYLLSAIFIFLQVLALVIGLFHYEVNFFTILVYVFMLTVSFFLLFIARNYLLTFQLMTIFLYFMLSL